MRLIIGDARLLKINIVLWLNQQQHGTVLQQEEEQQLPQNIGNAIIKNLLEMNCGWRKSSLVKDVLKGMKVIKRMMVKETITRWMNAV